MQINSKGDNIMKQGIALTPPMGWNSWDCYGASVCEDEVRGNANYMAENLKDYGWEYVVVDIQWYEPTADSSRYHDFAKLDIDEYGRLIPSVNRFPSSARGKGFKPLADYIHSKGLKFGIHILRGIPRQAVTANTPILGCTKSAVDVADISSTCPWNTDMYGIDATKEGAREYYESILNMYAEWNIDYIKVDDLSFPYSVGEVELLQNAILNTGRDIVFSLSPGETPLEKAGHLKEYANLWRMSGDFWDIWKHLYKQFELCDKWSEHIGPGHWPDADMLPFGHIGIRSCEHGKGDRLTNFTKVEQITLMTLWSIARSPLMFGGELRDNDQWTLDLITNDEVLSVLKNSFSNRQLYRMDDNVVWTAKNDLGYTYIALFNLTDETAIVSTSLTELKLSRDCNINKTFNLHDLWKHKDLGIVVDEISSEIEPHACKFFVIR